MRVTRVHVALAIILGMTAAASAEPQGLTPSNASEDLPSYRMQTALADAAALGVGILAAKSGSNGGDSLGKLAIGTYLLAAPIVHVVNDHPGRAVGSLALRAGLPLAGLLIGGAIGRSQCGAGCGDDADIGLAILGALTGFVAASAIDIGYLSRGETVTRASIGPIVGTGPSGGVRVGLGGTF